jgi:hypothetical protein
MENAKKWVNNSNLEEFPKMIIDNEPKDTNFHNIDKEILSQLLVASIHLHSHCDEDWQNLISDELENLVDD